MNLDKAIATIKSGGVIAIATDTLYGIACDATNDLAVRKLYEIKGRDFKKQIAISVASLEDLRENVKTEKYDAIIQITLPGPYTFILEKSENSKISRLLNNNEPHIGVRIPDDVNILKISKF